MPRISPFLGRKIRNLALTAAAAPNLNPVATSRVQTITVTNTGLVAWVADLWRVTCAGGAWLIGETAHVTVDDGVNPLAIFEGIALGGETDAQMAALVYANYLGQALTLNYKMIYTGGNAFVDLGAWDGAAFIYGAPTVVPPVVASDTSAGSSFAAVNTNPGVNGSKADVQDNGNFGTLNHVQYIGGGDNALATLLAAKILSEDAKVLTSAAVANLITVTGDAPDIAGAGYFDLAVGGQNSAEVVLTFADVAEWSSGDLEQQAVGGTTIGTNVGIVSLQGATVGGTLEISVSVGGSATLQVWTKDATSGLWFNDVAFGSQVFAAGNHVAAFVLNGSDAYAFLTAITGSVNVTVRSTN